MISLILLYFILQAIRYVIFVALLPVINYPVNNFKSNYPIKIPKLDYPAYNNFKIKLPR